ncbi:MAG: sulfotransferase [Syntrophobacteraceae bacterium]|nr:sulfotransferase [Syntrophobacteraceae bacterium]
MPNLFIPGAGKSGTSSLHEYLNQHPDIYMSLVKEPHFFSRRCFPEGRVEYERLFEFGKNARYRGESSTGYMIFAESIGRMREYTREPKFIFLLRNPIDRAYSHYWWLRGSGFETSGFRHAIESDMFETPDPQKIVGIGYKYYFQEGCYAKWIKRYSDEFGMKRIHIITSESLRATPLQALNSCATFLGIELFRAMKETNLNTTAVFKAPSLYRLSRNIVNTGFGIKRCSTMRRMVKRVTDAISEDFSAHFLHLSNGLLDRFFRSDVRYPKISAEDRHWLQELYKGEVDELRELLSSPFDEWNEDF